MAAEDVANYALVMLGSTDRITDITGTGILASTANVAYPLVRKAELRRHAWNFARTSVSIAEDGTAPDVSTGYSHRYALPNGFIRLVETDENDDWQIAGDYILTDDKTPLYVTYIQDITDTDKWDDLFFEAVAIRLAFKLAPFLTGSNTKQQINHEDYRAVIAAAKKINSIEQQSKEITTDSWVDQRVT